MMGDGAAGLRGERPARIARALVLALAALLMCATAGYAQRGLEIRGALGDDPASLLNLPPKAAPPVQATPAITAPQRPQDASLSQPGQVVFTASVTEDGQRIEQGLIWRVFLVRGNADGSNKLVGQYRESAPSLRLPPGVYAVNVSYGQANVTRRITVQPGAQTAEPFVLNAGGLRVTALVGPNEQAGPGLVTFDVFSDERDQMGQRTRVIQNARPGTVYRLNSGLYQVVSQLGDANATMRTDVTVEPGKLTEATFTHAFAKATFRLVARQGGDAQPDTQWSIATPQGDVVRESAGALPTHFLAPGSYIVTARSGGRTFRRNIVLRRGENAQIEVLAQ
jgi:hypothetical protein